MKPSRGGGDCDRGMTPGSEDKHRVKRVLDQLLPGGELRGNAVLAGAGGARLLGHVADGGDLEAVRELP